MKKLLTLFTTAVLVLGNAALVIAEDDVQEPSRVEGLEGEAFDSAVKLTWDEATDNVAVTGYQVHYGTVSVGDEGQVYDTFVDVGDVLEYTVEGLQNDTEYFFSVIAYDEVGNESGFWADEVAVTPEAGTEAPADDEAPRVNEAEAMDNQTVKVTFSEAVSLDDVIAEDVFVVENESSFTELVVLDAELDTEEDSGAVVLLTTEVQEADADYKLTVGVDLKDLAGNPMISGTSDTALFTGSDVEPVEEGDVQLVAVIAKGDNQVELKFNGPVDLDVDPNVNFEILSGDEKLEIVALEMLTEGTVVLTTSAQSNIEYTVYVRSLLTEDTEMTFVGMSGDDTPLDPVSPKDVADFLAKKVKQAESYAVQLTWSIVREENENIVAQTLYTQKNGGSYSKTASLDADATEYEINNLQAGEYLFKLTQTNADGVESEGAVTKVILSETGPEVLGLLLMSVGAGRIYRRKGKK